MAPVYSAGGDDHRPDVWLLQCLLFVGLGQVLRRPDLVDGAIGGGHPVGDRRGGGHQVEVVLPLQSFAHDLHVEQPEEAAAEPESEGARRLGLIDQRRVVEPELLQGVAEAFEVVAVGGEQPRIHHRVGLGVPGERLGGGARCRGDRVPHPDPVDLLDTGDQIPDLAAGQLGQRNCARCQHTDFGGAVLLAGGEEPDRIPTPQPPIHHPQVADHSAVDVVVGVEHQSTERVVGPASRRRDLSDDSIE